tara:strand:+ start:4992 stop:7592 length:2601 start_codon:yes stop_codon:yes gene_type:complete
MPDFSKFFNNTMNDSIQKAIQDRPLLDPVLDGSIKQLRKALIETFEPNKLNGQTEFRAICLRGLAHVTSGQSKRQIRIKARIPELHTFLPMPRFIDDLITFSLYPTFVGSEPDIGLPAGAANQDASVTSIPAGSEVVVTFGNMKNWANPTIVRVLRFGPASGVTAGVAESQLPAARGGSAQPVRTAHANPANPHSYHIAAGPTAPGVPFAPPAPPAGQLYAGKPRGSADPCKGIKLTPSKYKALLKDKSFECLKCGKQDKNVSGAAGAICADPIVNRLFNVGNRQSGGVTDIIKRSLELMAYTRYGIWDASIAHATADVVIATHPQFGDAMKGLWTHRHQFAHKPGTNGARPRAAAPPIVEDPQFWSTPRQAQVWRNDKWKKVKTRKSWGGQDKKMMGSKKHLGMTAYKKDGTPYTIENVPLWTIDGEKLPPGYTNGWNGLPYQVVVHQSCGTTRTRCIRDLNAKKLGTHFTITNDGKIHQHVDIRRVTSHAAGKGNNINSNSIGIDMITLCSWHGGCGKKPTDTTTKAQKKAYYKCLDKGRLNTYRGKAKITDEDWLTNIYQAPNRVGPTPENKKIVAESKRNGKPRGYEGKHGADRFYKVRWPQRAIDGGPEAIVPYNPKKQFFKVGGYDYIAPSEAALKSLYKLIRYLQDIIPIGGGYGGDGGLPGYVKLDPKVLSAKPNLYSYEIAPSAPYIPGGTKGYFFGHMSKVMKDQYDKKLFATPGIFGETGKKDMRNRPMLRDMRRPGIFAHGNIETNRGDGKVSCFYLWLRMACKPGQQSGAHPGLSHDAAMTELNTFIQTGKSKYIILAPKSGTSWKQVPDWAKSAHSEKWDIQDDAEMWEGTPLDDDYEDPSGLAPGGNPNAA